MNKNDYLKKLDKALKNLSKEERQRTLSYYRELIEDRVEEGIPEAQAVSELESPEAVASRILAETGARPAKKGLGAGAIVAIVLASLLLLFLIIYPLFLLPAMVFEDVGQTSVPVSTGNPSQHPGEGLERTELSFNAGSDFGLELNVSDLELLPSEDGRYHLTYDSDDQLWYELSENGSTVRLVEKSKKSSGINWSIIGGIINGSGGIKRTVTLKVPADDSAVISAESLSGGLSARDLRAGSLRLESVSGRITLESVECSLSLKAYSVSGSFLVSRSSAPDCVLEGTSGSARLTACSFPALACSTISGDCELYATEFDSLSFDTVSGDLEGDLTGKPEDYSVYFSTTSGDNSLAYLRTRGSRTIEFSSVSGDLDLEFPGLDYDD